MNATMFKTKKAAREAGYLPASEWFKKFRIPKQGTTPVVTKGEEFFAGDDCEDLVSRTEAGKRGLRIKKGAVAAETKTSLVGGSVWKTYELFRISDCEDKRAYKDIAPQTIDLLLAIFTVSRAAHRYRDSSQKHYKSSKHGFARHAKDTKSYLYDLKDRGIMEAHRHGRLVPEGIHGGLMVYRGGGYCFHSTIVPESFTASEQSTDDVFFNESEPKGASEARLKDAVFTLEKLPSSKEEFSQLPRPEVRSGRS